MPQLKLCRICHEIPPPSPDDDVCTECDGEQPVRAFSGYVRTSEPVELDEEF